MIEIKRYAMPYHLEIGCGSTPLQPYDYWIHSDIMIADPHTEITCPAWEVPLSDSSCDEIFMRGVWEHFNYAEADRVLSECARLLIPGGILTLNFPPIDHAIDLWNSAAADWLWFRRVLYGWQRHQHDIHKSGWTRIAFEEFTKQEPQLAIMEIFFGITSENQLDGYIERLSTEAGWNRIDATMWTKLRKIDG